MRRASLLIIAALVACKGKRPRDAAEPGDDARARTDAAPADAAAPAVWPALAHLTQTRPLRVVTLPAKPHVPRFDVAGPVITGDLAIVGSSQLGFAAVDWRRGTLAWTKATGSHLAPPLVRGDDILLLADCVSPPDVPDDEQLLGCLRSVTPTGADQAYIAIHGPRASVVAFAAERGTQDVWPAGDQAVRWRRGEQAVVIDTVTGVARPASAVPPPIRVTYKTHHWDVTQVDGRVLAKEGAREAWSTKRAYTALLTAVRLAEQPPMIRIANAGDFAGEPEINVLDIDATGSMNGQAAFPVPGIALIGSGSSEAGDVALAVRLDTSLRHDFIAAYAANAFLMWVYALPPIPRADPVGIAVTSDAVVVFHDGETVTVLPGPAASQKTTP